MLNQLSRSIKNKVAYFNTKFRDNYYKTTSSDFCYNLPMEIRNAISVRLHSIDIPNTIYNISKNNNIFFIKIHSRPYEDIKNGCLKPQQTYNIMIPEGNYSVRELMDYLNQTYFYQKKTPTDLKYIKFNIEENTLKSEFQILENAPKYYMFDINFLTYNVNSIVYTIGWNLGFRMGQYNNIFKNLISEGMFDAGGDRYIYFSLDDFNVCSNDDNLIALDNNIIDKNILGKIYLKDGIFKANILDNDTKYDLKKRCFNGAMNINRIKVKLYDEYGNIINLNNMDFSFALDFELLYEKW